MASDALSSVNGIPKRIRISGMTEDVTTLDLTSSKRTDDAPYAPLTGAPAPDDPAIEKPLAAAMAATPETVAAAAEALVAEGVAAAQAGRMLKAILAFLERTLVSGDDLPPEFSAHREAITADANVKAFLQALRPANAEEARAAIATMSRLQLLVPRKAYALAMYKANFSTNLGEPDAAAKDFHAALAKNPLLTGVWKDLGFIHYNGYDAPGAWRCWDAARRIAPQHGMLSQVTKLEAQMLAEHPEYF